MVLLKHVTESFHIETVWYYIALDKCSWVLPLFLYLIKQFFCAQKIHGNQVA